MEYLAATQRRGRIARYLVPLLLAAAAVAVVIVVSNAPSGSSTHVTGSTTGHVGGRPQRPFWTVHPGDTLAQIAVHTGLTVNRLEALNPNVDPNALQPGERLNLWRHPPRPHKRGPKLLGPLYWTVQPGQSFGSIAADTGIAIFTLEQLNPHLRAAPLQPGDRVKLRHGPPLGQLLQGAQGAALAAAWRGMARSGSTPQGNARHAKAHRSTGLF